MMAAGIPLAREASSAASASWERTAASSPPEVCGSKRMVSVSSFAAPRPGYQLLTEITIAPGAARMAHLDAGPNRRQERHAPRIDPHHAGGLRYHLTGVAEQTKDR